MYKNITIFLFLLLFSTSSFLSQIKVHKHLTTEDGLINNKILSMYQDSKGYIWFGTMGGVSKWDGINFTNFTKSNGLPSSAVISIIESPDSIILLSTYYKGFVTVKDEIIDTINKNNGLYSNFVNRFKIIGGKLIVISNIAQQYKAGKFIKLNYKIDKIKGPLSDLIIEKNKNIFVGSRTNGIYIKDGKVDKVFTREDGLLSDKIQKIAKDSSGYVLIATTKGVNKYKNGKIFTLKRNGKIFTALINDLLVSKDGTNYYTSDKGLIIEKNNSVELLKTENGLLDNNLDQLLEDTNGTIYIGYEHSGVSIYNPNRFSNYKPNDNSTKFYATSIIQNTDTSIMLGTEDGITTINRDKITQRNSKNGLIYDNVYSLHKAKDELYVGSDNNFSIIKNGKIIPYYLGNKPHHEIYDIISSPDGDIIMAMRREGLKIFTKKNQRNKTFLNNFIKTSDPLRKKNLKKNNNLEYWNRITKQKEVTGGTLNTITLLHGLQNTWVLDLFMSKDSTLVIGYHGGGASFYKNGKFKHLKKEDGLADEIVTTIFQHKNRNYWLGTRQGGITIYDITTNSIVDTINTDDGLSSNDIRGIVQLKDKIYTTTSRGLDILLKYPDSLFIRKVKSIDGLVSNNCNPGSILLDNENNIWIGTGKGVSKYNPEADKIISTPPKIFFSGIKIFNKEYLLNKFLKEKKLSFNQNYLKFIFSAINLSAPDKIKYKYRLSGVDINWVETSENYAPYTNLGDGNYTFEVKARNEWGYWSKPISASFTITPAWWETWWFRLLIITIVSFLVWALIQYRLNYLLKIERLRTKIASDLHDDVGSLLTQISINADSLNYTNDSKKIKEKSGFIVNKSGEVIDLMRDVIWSIDTRNDTLESLVDRIHNFALEFLPQKNIKLEFNNQIKDLNIKLKIDIRQNIMMIAKEAINNSVKYSECDVIKIDLSYNNKKFKMKIADNGKGLDFENIKLGNGLKNMRMRAEMIDAVINFKNDAGMVVCLTKNKI